MLKQDLGGGGSFSSSELKKSAGKLKLFYLQYQLMGDYLNT